MPKKPRHKGRVEPEKRPKWLPLAPDGRIRISFALFDASAKWSQQQDDESHFPNVARKLRQYESMRWMEIVSRDHRVQLGKLVHGAQKRLIELKLDDIDELWRFQLSGLRRLWGIRFRDCFYALWWDPEHVVCPSTLKHT